MDLHNRNKQNAASCHQVTKANKTAAAEIIHYTAKTGYFPLYITIYIIQMLWF